MNRILYNAKMVKGECNDKTEKLCFSDFGTAESHPILCKYMNKNRKPSVPTLFNLKKRTQTLKNTAIS